MLVEGIIILVIGIIVFALQNAFSSVGARTAARYIGVILIVIGAILIILSILGIAFLSLGALSYLSPTPTPLLLS